MAASAISNDKFPSSSFGGSDEKPTKTIIVDREHTVVPAHPSHRHNVIVSALDLRMIMLHYNQKGLLYEMPVHCISSAVNLLEKSLSQVLTNFYPLAGRLATSPSDGAISIDCNDAGATFIEASADNVNIADLMTAEVTAELYQLFPLNGFINLQGHRFPLLAMQVTKLRDGIFVACTINHAVVDGLSLWHFFNSWAEICRGAQKISVNPIHDRCLFTPPRSRVRLNLDPDADIRRFSPPPLRTKMFHFSKDMIQGLKDRANRESPGSPVSSLQALCGHVWQAVTRARRLDPQDPTTFQLSVDCRGRLVPPLPSSYFGNAIQSVRAATTAGEMARNDVSFPAQLLRTVIQNHGDMSVKETIDGWEKDVRNFAQRLEARQNVKNLLILGSSPRFKMYETDFGFGKPVAARSGCANKLDGKVHAYPGKEGDGSIDLEICLVPNTMDAFEIDEQFLHGLPV